MSYKKYIDAGTRKTSSELLFSLLLFSFPVFLFFLCGECFHETLNAFWSTYGWGASNSTSILPISDFHQQVTRQPWPLRSCERDVIFSPLHHPKLRKSTRLGGEKYGNSNSSRIFKAAWKTLWEWHTLNDLLAGFARKTILFVKRLCQHHHKILQPIHKADAIFFHFSQFSLHRWKTEASCPVVPPDWAPPCLMLQPAELLHFHCWGWSSSTGHRVYALWQSYCMKAVFKKYLAMFSQCLYSG